VSHVSAKIQRHAQRCVLLQRGLPNKKFPAPAPDRTSLRNVAGIGGSESEMIGLSDDQLKTLMAAAGDIPADKRSNVPDGARH
jgi:hypothetical protein